MTRSKWLRAWGGAVLIASAGVLLAGQVKAQAPPLLAAWGTHGTGPGQFYDPLGLALGSNGDLYLTDSGDPMCPACGGWRVQRFTREGVYVAQWGSYGNEAGQFMFPGFIAADAQAHLYVSDGGASRVQKFTSDGQFLTAWGSFGAADGQFKNQRGVTVDASGNVFVADAGNNRIQKFDGDGYFLLKWGTLGIGPGGFVSPWAIGVDVNGDVYVADQGGRLQKFSGTGGYLGEWRGLYASFAGPYGIAFGPDGSVYVADTGRCLVQKFAPDGTFLTYWGALGSGPGQFSSGPQGIAVDAQGRVYTADSGNHRVQVFGEQPTPVRTGTWGRLKGLYR